jgi:hypothetical protein
MVDAVRRRLALLTGVLGLAAVLLVPGAARAVDLVTNIDLDYTYEQAHKGQEITAGNSVRQKYEVKYSASLTTALALLFDAKVDLENKWASRTATTSHIAPSLSLDIKGSQSAFRATYQSTQDTTGAFQESGTITTYSYNMSTELQVTPDYWPELRLKLDRKRDFQLQAADRTTVGVEFQARKDINALRLELSLRQAYEDQILPDETAASDLSWTGKATYKEVLYGDTEFELGYEIKETYRESSTRGVSVTPDESYQQTFKTRFRNSLELTPRLTVGLTWEYQFDQDLLQLEYDYKLRNQYGIEARYDLIDWVKVYGELRRGSDLTVAAGAEEDDRRLTDTLRAAVDADPWDWLRLSGKADFKKEQGVVPDTGGSVDVLEEEKYEAILKNKFGNFWDLVVDATSTTEHTDGWMTAKEGKFKADLRLRIYSDFSFQPSYEANRATDWDARKPWFNSQKQSGESKFRFEYKHSFFDLLGVTFSHEYGIKREDELDKYLNFERTITMSESTKLNVALADLFEGMKIEGQVERKGSDVQDDASPVLVDVAYSLKFDWQVSLVSLSTGVTYNDKGGAYDDLGFNAKVDLKTELVDLGADYTFTKVFSDEIDETRRLNFKMSMRF